MCTGYILETWLFILIFEGSWLDMPTETLTRRPLSSVWLARTWWCHERKKSQKKWHTFFFLFKVAAMMESNEKLDSLIESVGRVKVASEHHQQAAWMFAHLEHKERTVVVFDFDMF